MNLKARIPEGTQDLLPSIAKEKRDLEWEILNLFKDWGYQELVTPTLEYLDSISNGTGEGLQRKMYKLFDRRGEILTLRAEMTTPIARLVAHKLKNLLPAKVCYLANLFRYEDLQRGRYREFYQAGLEHIGGEGAPVDAEVLALSIEALELAGLRDFTIHVGHMLFFQGLCAEYRLDHEKAASLREALINRDFVTFKELILKSTLNEWQKENLLLLPTLQERGRIPEKAYALAGHALSREAVENLEEILHYLSLLGVDHRVSVDLGIFRDLDYYSGMVFEGFTAGVGFNICGGGRYDRLLGEFGLERPACGFALGIDRILLALKREGLLPKKKRRGSLILYEKRREEEAYQLFLSLKKRGEGCELELLTRPIHESINYARKKHIAYLLYVGDRPSCVWQEEYRDEEMKFYKYDLSLEEGELC